MQHDYLSAARIETERLVLLPISLQWKEDIFREFNEEITHYLMGKPAKNVAETEAFIASAIEDMEKGEELVFVITQREDNAFLGCCDIHRLQTTTPEMGIWLKKSAHGKGYGLEAMRALKQWMDEHLEYEYITYPVDRDNKASRKLIEALGGTVQKEYEKESLSGNILHAVEYWIPSSRSSS